MYAILGIYKKGTSKKKSLIYTIDIHNSLINISKYLLLSEIYNMHVIYIFLVVNCWNYDIIMNKTDVQNKF